VEVRVGLVLVFCILVLNVPGAYAQEQNIVESFGLYSRGIEYYRVGKLYEAKEILEKAIENDSRNVQAKGYLDLVNAELEMRAKGRLDSYQKFDELKRESDFVKVTIDPEEEYSDYAGYKDEDKRLPEWLVVTATSILIIIYLAAAL